MKKNVNICLTGGGTVGSVSPLLSVFDELKNKYTFFWIGSKFGIEKRIVKNIDIKFKSIYSGKLRRYFSWKNFIDPVLIIIAFAQSLLILAKNKPNLIISAGSFISVPVIWAGWLLRIPILIHQMDYRPGLANKLMAPFAKKITVALEKSLDDYSDKAIWIGNFIRKEFKQYQISGQEAKQRLNLNNELPVALILGGGTGSKAINILTQKSLSELTKFCQIVHIIGKRKGLNLEPIKNYHPIEFVYIDGMIKSFMAADIVVSRCGMGVLTEISFLGKPAILIPLPDSHQEDNAKIFFKEKAAMVLDQNGLTPEKFSGNILKLLKDDLLRGLLRGNIKKVIRTSADKEISRVIEDLILSNK
ncbi:MAG: UDP-N-acetylglucosamine--N-acetylmuramyl-(pentapeptide) pyrophosphoryl-undecaprenol N-acetylglucosamine transferase [Patescibacteria group bacterium]|nr:UDP-N-acetylglucosamine--N-acetylmuramyl-(pentapeptide) pyrophosphoryl-undecaprenol N-acetylglucosamine transferase [Patescibacteria group bacterium]